MSQGSLNVPVVGPDPPANFAAQINTAIDAVISKNSGGTAPTNFPTTGGAATQGQDWWDTSPGLGIIDARFYDGVSFLNTGGIDSTNHYWMPKIGGGSSAGLNVAAGGTIDVGSIRAAYVFFNTASLSAPITSFSNNALLNIGETKFIEATAPGVLTFSAALKTPGSVDLLFNVGDTWQAIYLGGGNWRVFNYCRASALGKPTGELFMLYTTAAPAGAVRANALTIGNLASGATERANADTANLFIWIYLNSPAGNGGNGDGAGIASGGRTAPGNTRAAAITDYNLNKTITLPDGKNRILLATQMGGTDPHRMGGALFSSGNANTLGAVGGEAAHVNALTEITPHNHQTTAVPSIAAAAGPGGSGAPNAATAITSTKSGGKSITVSSASPGVVNWGSAHGFAADQPFQFDFETGGAVPLGTSVGTTYYVSATGLTANTFQFSLTPGGASVNTTSTGTTVMAWAAHNSMPPFLIGGTLCMAL